MKLGTHTFRKTGYLLAIWGNGEMSEIMIAARHKSLSEADKYRKDALNTKEVAKVHNDPMERVSQHWRSPRREQAEVQRKLNVSAIPYQKPLDELAKDFIYTRLGVSKFNPKIHHPHYLAQLSLTWSRTADSSTLIAELQETLSAAQNEKLEIAISMRMAELTAAKEATDMVVTDEAIGRIVGFPNDDDNDRHKKLKRGENGEDLKERLQLRGLKTTGEKLASIQNIIGKLDGGAALTEGARKFVQKQARPILGCFEHHCSSSTNIFSCRWPMMMHTQFPCKGKKEETCAAFNG
jgi:hypothetical protein